MCWLQHAPRRNNQITLNYFWTSNWLFRAAVNLPEFKLEKLHKQGLCDSMNSFFFQPKSHILVFIWKVFILINNLLLSTAIAKYVNTDYYI